MQHPNDYVKLPGNPKVKEEGRNQIAREVAQVHHFRWSQREVLVDTTVQDEMGNASQHPVYSCLVNSERLIVVIRAPKRLIIDHGKKWEAHIRQHEKIGQSCRVRYRLLLMPEIVEIDNETEHKHRTQNGPNRWRPGYVEPTHP